MNYQPVKDQKDYLRNLINHYTENLRQEFIANTYGEFIQELKEECIQELNLLRTVDMEATLMAKKKNIRELLLP